MWNTFFDPNIVVYLCVFQLPVQGNNSKFLCCLCCKTGPISALFRVDRSGYVPGDSIILNFDPNIVIYLCVFQLPVQGNNSNFLCCLCCKTGPISALFRVDRSSYVPGDSIILNFDPNIVVYLCVFQLPVQGNNSKFLCCLCCKTGPISALFCVDRSGYVPGDSIILNFDPNIVVYLCVFQLPVQGNNSKFLCCLCCKTGPISALFCVDRSGYVPGDSIILNFDPNIVIYLCVFQLPVQGNNSKFLCCLCCKTGPISALFPVDRSSYVPGDSIILNFDPNIVVYLCVFQLPVQGNNSKFLCCLCCKTGPISALFRVDRSGYVPGDSIILNFDPNIVVYLCVFQLPVQGNNSKFLCCLCCKTGPISALFRVDRSGYVPGDSIILNFDPNIVVYLCVFQLPVQGNNSKFLCCLCCKTGPISALFRVDRSGYVPGDSIILNFDPNIVVYLCVFQLPVQGNNSKFLCCLCCKTGPISVLLPVDRSSYVPGDSIILNFDPNVVVYLCVFQLPVQGNNSKFLCCLCCKTGPISALFRVDRSGYVPGDSIILNFDPNIVVYSVYFSCLYREITPSFCAAFVVRLDLYRPCSA